jgi:gamma-glutamyl hercynylcysteine S-oxide synthase
MDDLRIPLRKDALNMTIVRPQLTTDRLAWHLKEARQRSLELVADLSDEQMIGPRLAIVNPLRWEIAHVAFFQEFWCLRHLRGFEPIKAAGNLDSDLLYDSARVDHNTRWDLPLPTKKDTISYTGRIFGRVIEEAMKTAGQEISDAAGYDERYFLQLSLLHEDMHNEAITYTRQTLGYRAPNLDIESIARSECDRAPVRDDTSVPGGIYQLGSSTCDGFVFDNEQWAHEMTVAPFVISRTAVSNAAFTAFVNDGGYRHRDFWCEEGWQWRENANALHPVYWKSIGDVISIDGLSWRPICRSSMSTGTKRLPTAVGLEDVCPPSRNGRWLPRVSRPPMVTASHRANAFIPGAMILRRLVARISIGSRWDVCLSALYRQVTAHSVVVR